MSKAPKKHTIHKSENLIVTRPRKVRAGTRKSPWTSRDAKYQALIRTRWRTKVKSDFYEMTELSEPDEKGNLYEYKNRPPTRLNDKELHKFLTVYEQIGTIVGTCRQLCMCPKAIDFVKLREESFAEAMKEAYESFLCKLQEAARRRAVPGVRKAVYYQGKIVGYEREYSDRLMESLLAAHMANFSRKDKQDKSQGGLTIKLAVINNPNRQKALDGVDTTIHVDTEGVSDPSVELHDGDEEG